MSDDLEIWKSIPGWEGIYSVSSIGRVRSEPRLETSRGDKAARKKFIPGRILALRTTKRGYKRCNLSLNGEAKTCGVHRLVCLAFYGEPNAGDHAAHNNGDPSDNRVSNLRWATPKQNNFDRIAHGTSSMRAQNPRAVLSENDVAKIRATRGASQEQIAREFGISPSQVRNVQKGASWPTEGPIDTAYLKENMRSRVAKLTWDDVREIRRCRHLGPKVLAEKFGVHPTNINCILRGATWRE